jgi:class 3 adenylate cyclase
MRAMRQVRLPIALALALSFGALIAIAVAAVLLLMRDVAERNTRDLLVANAEESVSAVYQALDNQTDAARQQAGFLTGLIQADKVTLEETDRLQDLLLGSLAAVPELTFVALVRSDLFGVVAARDALGEPYMADARTQMRNSQFRLALRKGLAASGPLWSDVSYAPELQSSFLPLLVPILHGKEALGVIAIGVSLSGLSQRMEQQFGASGVPFIVTMDGYVIAHPSLVAHADVLSPDKPLLTMAQVDDPALAAFRLDPLGEPDFHAQYPNATISIQQVSAGDEDSIFLYRKIEGFGNTPWLIGVHYSTGRIALTLERISKAVIAGVGVLILAVLLAVIFGRVLSRPIRRLAQSAEHVSQLQLAHLPPLRGSVLKELDIAARAHNAMVTGLRWFETYVPKALLPILLRRDEPTLDPRESEVSVLFTDIVGFSHTGQRLEAPRLAEFLNRHFALLGECIQAEGGTIDKYIGDSVMAFWGAPVAQSDHAERACRAALAIAESLAADNERRHAKGLPPVRIRLGLHCGKALAGNIGAPGRINYTLVGDTVNVAQRLEQFGKQIDDGNADVIIVASADFIARIADDVVRMALGAQLLPGRATETEVFRLLITRPPERPT